MRAWYQRWRMLIGEAWRFMIVGGTNVALNFVLFNAFAILLFRGSELKANLVATALATTSSYLMNRSWTFRHRRTSRIPREYVLFFAFNAAALSIELAVMGAAKYGLGIHALWALNLAKLLGLALGTVFRFWTYRTFVFAGQPSLPTVPAEEMAHAAAELAAHEHPPRAEAEPGGAGAAGPRPPHSPPARPAAGPPATALANPPE